MSPTSRSTILVGETCSWTRRSTTTARSASTRSSTRSALARSCGGSLCPALRRCRYRPRWCGRRRACLCGSPHGRSPSSSTRAQFPTVRCCMASVTNVKLGEVLGTLFAGYISFSLAGVVRSAATPPLDESRLVVYTCLMVYTCGVYLWCILWCIQREKTR